MYNTQINGGIISLLVSSVSMKQPQWFEYILVYYVQSTCN